METGSVKKNTIYSIIKSCSSVVFPLITFPYISRVLQAENVGKINFGNSIVSYFSLFASLGISTYAIRECAKVRENRQELNDKASQILSINIITTILSYVGLLLILLLARPLENYRVLIVIQSSIILFSTLGADWINMAMEDFKFITLRTFFFQLLSLILMFIFVRDPDDYMIYAVISVISSSGANIVNILYRKKYCKMRFTWQMNIGDHLPPVLKLFATLLSQQIFCSADTTMLGLLRGDFEVGLYSTAVKIYNIVNNLMSSITWVVMPKLSAAFSKKDYEEISGLLSYALNFIATIGFPCVVGMGTLAAEIVEVIAGPEYLSASTALQILSITLAISLLWGFVMNIILLPSGMDGVCMRACIFSAAFNLIFNGIFIPKFGLVAAAITTACSQFVGLMLCLPAVDKRIKIHQWKKTIAGPILGSIVVFIFVTIIKIITDHLWIKTVFSIGGSVFLYFVIQILMKNEIVIGMKDSLIQKIKK